MSLMIRKQIFAIFSRKNRSTLSFRKQHPNDNRNIFADFERVEKVYSLNDDEFYRRILCNKLEHKADSFTTELTQEEMQKIREMREVSDKNF